MKCPPKIHKIYHKRQQTTNTNDQQLAGSLGIIVQCQQPPVLVSGTNQGIVWGQQIINQCSGVLV